MKMAMMFLMGFLCAVVVLLVAAQAPSQLGHYQILTPEASGGLRVLQLDTDTGRLYLREWYQGRVHDLGTLHQPLAMPRPKSPATPGTTRTEPPK